MRIGSYSLIVEARGFQASRTEGIRVEIGNVHPTQRQAQGGFGQRDNLGKDISVSKRQSKGETRFLEFRTDWFNAFNRARLSAPATDLTRANFGRITSQNSPRVIQFGFRLGF